MRELTATLDRSSTELRSTLDSLRECRAQFGQATVIMEFAPGREMQLLGGWLDLRPGEVAPDFGAHGARWYISARVKPVFYGDETI